MRSRRPEPADKRRCSAFMDLTHAGQMLAHGCTKVTGPRCTKVTYSYNKSSTVPTSISASTLQLNQHHTREHDAASC